MGISHITNTNAGNTQLITLTNGGEPNWSIIHVQNIYLMYRLIGKRYTSRQKTY